MRRVLIVDDNSSDRKHLLKGLDGKAECAVAQNGDEALKMYQNSLNSGSPYQFILLDITMPQKDGLAVLKSIRALEEAAGKTNAHEAHIIMITSFKDSLMEYYNMGWDDFITKPVDTDILFERMQQMESSEKNKKAS